MLWLANKDSCFSCHKNVTSNFEHICNKEENIESLNKETDVKKSQTVTFGT
jgi:hypothetical protein